MENEWCELGVGTACVNQWGGKGSGGSEKQKGKWREFRGAEALAEPREDHGLSSGELCSDLTRSRPASCSRSWTLCFGSLASWKLLPSLMKRAMILLLYRKPSGHWPPQSMQDTVLHSCCGGTRVSWPCPELASRYMVWLELQSCRGALESRGSQKHKFVTVP